MYPDRVGRTPIGDSYFSRSEADLGKTRSVPLSEDVPRSRYLSVCAHGQQLISQFYWYSTWKLQQNDIEARLLTWLSVESTACHRQLPFGYIYDRNARLFLLLCQRNMCFPEATLILISRRRSRCDVPLSGDVPGSGLFLDPGPG